MRKKLSVVVVLVVLLCFLWILLKYEKGKTRNNSGEKTATVTPTLSVYKQKSVFRDEKLKLFPDGSIKGEYADFSFRIELSAEKWADIRGKLLEFGWHSDQDNSWDDYPFPRGKLLNSEEESRLSEQLKYERNEGSLAKEINHVTEFIGVMDKEDCILLFYNISFCQGDTIVLQRLKR